MNDLFGLFTRSFLQVWVSFTHNWPFLLVSVLIAVALKLYLKPEKVSAFLTRYQRAGVLGATAAAVATPLCSCGTTAVILGMIASTMPWSPIVAFMVSSPLTSPQELVYSAGIFGWRFAIAFFISSIVLGLLGGAAAEFLEARGWLKNQTRFDLNSKPLAGETEGAEAKPLHTTPTQAAAEAVGVSREQTPSACGCGQTSSPTLSNFRRREATLNRPVLTTIGASLSTSAPVMTSCCAAPGESALPLPKPASQNLAVNGQTACSCQATRPDVAAAQPKSEAQRKVTLRDFASETWEAGKRLLVMFFGFAFIGYFLNGLIPPEWVSAIFGPGNLFSVPLAATLGLPLYINSEASLPLVRAMIDGGMSEGAALAFLISGSGTSIGAIAGAMTIARWRVVGLVIGTLWVGAILAGVLYNLL